MELKPRHKGISRLGGVTSNIFDLIFKALYRLNLLSTAFFDLLTNIQTFAYFKVSENYIRTFKKPVL